MPISASSRKFTREKVEMVLRKGPFQKKVLLGAVEAGQERAVKKAWLLRSARASSFARRKKNKARVDGESVGERSRRKPRAHRFQMVEGTQAVEQPSSFAGWRSVGGLGCRGPRSNPRACRARVYGLRDLTSQEAGLTRRHTRWALQLHTGSHGNDKKSARRAKEEGIAERHRWKISS